MGFFPAGVTPIVPDTTGAAGDPAASDGDEVCEGSARALPFALTAGAVVGGGKDAASNAGIDDSSNSSSSAGMNCAVFGVVVESIIVLKRELPLLALITANASSGELLNSMYIIYLWRNLSRRALRHALDLGSK